MLPDKELSKGIVSKRLKTLHTPVFRLATAAVWVLLTLVMVLLSVLRLVVVVLLRVCSEVLSAAMPVLAVAPTELICPVRVEFTVLTVPPSVVTV